MIKIYHNPRCSKSRCALDLLKSSDKDFDIIDYMKNPLEKADIEAIIAKLGIQPIELVRTKEPIWKERFHNKSLTNEEIIEAMLQFPQLIERPIVIKENKAIIGRPTEKIIDFLS